MKQLWAWILGLGTLAGAFLIWWSKKNAANTFAQALEAQRMKELAAANYARAEQHMKDADATVQSIQDAQDAVQEAQRAILLVASELPPGKIYEMDNAQIAAALTEIGF